MYQISDFVFECWVLNRSSIRTIQWDQHTKNTSEPYQSFFLPELELQTSIGLGNLIQVELWSLRPVRKKILTIEISSGGIYLYSCYPIFWYPLNNYFFTKTLTYAAYTLFWSGAEVIMPRCTNAFHTYSYNYASDTPHNFSSIIQNLWLWIFHWKN